MDTVVHFQTDLWDTWQTGCRALGIRLEATQRSVFERFYVRLMQANQTTNLTRITTEEDFLYRHLLDSLAIAPLLPSGATLVDVGSGAGFPAIPVAIIRPDVSILAVDAVLKKCRFMESMQTACALANLTVLHARAETLGQTLGCREWFDVVTARAVAKLPVLLEWCLPLVKVGGQFLAMKGVHYDAERSAAENALKTLGGRFVQVILPPHPQLAGSRILRFDKVRMTAKIYPRPAGMASKRPL